jgi:quercetin dioxygenase-like cupin family protein
MPAIEVIASQDESMSHPEPGLRRQVMSWSPDMMLVRHRMKKGWVGARHSHPHEQMVYIVSGHLTFEYPGGVFEAKTGDSLVWTPNLRHMKIETPCSERRFGWQVPEFSGWNIGLQSRDEF